MARLKCDCGKYFEGMFGKEDTCPTCLRRLIKGETDIKEKSFEELEKKLLKNKNVRKITIAVRRKAGY